MISFRSQTRQQKHNSHYCFPSDEACTQSSTTCPDSYEGQPHEHLLQNEKVTHDRCVQENKVHQKYSQICNFIRIRSSNYSRASSREICKSLTHGRQQRPSMWASVNNPLACPERTNWRKCRSRKIQILISRKRSGICMKIIVK
jgi:hypothetical protein